jgi:hypothetical protein
MDIKMEFVYSFSGYTTGFPYRRYHNKNLNQPLLWPVSII